jgi:PD-(D/E)XK endonuclease
MTNNDIRTMTVAPSMRDRLASNLLGALAVEKVVYRAIVKGWTPCRPLLECRYDLILDDGFKPYRVQVKYAGQKTPKQASGVIPVGLKKWRTDGRPPLLCYTTEEIDALLVYVPTIDEIFWFGPEVFAGRQNLYIRLEPTRNGQQKGCLMAANYVW